MEKTREGRILDMIETLNDSIKLPEARIEKLEEAADAA